MHSFWRRNLFTMVGFTGGLLRTIVENSWLFTAIPLPGQDKSDPLAKFGYFLTAFLAYEIEYMLLGRGVDLLREMKQSEATPLRAYAPTAER